MTGDHCIKLLIVGPSGVGKSALLLRYCDDLFEGDSSTATIGVDFKTKKISVHGRPYTLTLLDTAGQERFRALSSSYYRGAHGALIVYDITSKDSFSNLDRWFAEVRNNASPEAILYLVRVCFFPEVGSKQDKDNLRAVRYAEGASLAKEHGVSFCEVSSKTKDNVRRPFIELVDQIVASPNLMRSMDEDKATFPIQNSAPPSSCSC